MLSKLTVSQATYELEKVLKKLKSFPADAKIECYHIWMDEDGWDQTERINLVNAIQVYESKGVVQMDINCYD